MLAGTCTLFFDDPLDDNVLEAMFLLLRSVDWLDCAVLSTLRFDLNDPMFGFTAPNRKSELSVTTELNTEFPVALLL